MEDTKATAKTIPCKICTVETMVFHGEKHCPRCGAGGAEVFKSAARLEKALKLAQTMAAVGADATAIHNTTTRRLAEKIAGVNESSDATWAMVAVLLKGNA